MNITTMNLKKCFLMLVASLLVLTVMAQPTLRPDRYPKREFRGAWIQAVNGQFRGLAPQQMQQMLIGQAEAAWTIWNEEDDCPSVRG